MITPDKRTRPLPVDGLARATRDGRRRRRMAIGAFTGTAAAVVAVAVLSTSVGSHDARSTLQPAATTAPSATPTAVQRLVNGAGPRTTAAPCGGCGSTPPASSQPVPVLPTPTASQEPQRSEAGTAPDYREDPVVGAAPLQCQSVPQGQAGPVYTGGGSACSSSGGGPSTVKQGGTTEGDLGVCVSYGAPDVAFGFTGGQEHEVLVLDDAGRTVYTFSDTVRFTQGAHSRTLKAGTCATYVGKWDTRTTAGQLVPAGRYTLKVLFRPATENGSPGSPGGSEMTVQVTR